MKILFITSYVTISSRPEFSRNKTGFGYMVLDIARTVSKMEEVDLLASDSSGNAFVRDNVLFLKRSWWLFVAHIFQCLPLASVLRMYKKYPKMHQGTRARLLYYWLLSGYCHNILKEGHYDVIHIHGCGLGTELWIQVCKKCNQKFVITLHGLNSFSDTVRLEPAGKQYEQDFLRRVVEGEFPITVISTGMKRLIEKEYGVSDCKNITVVCNSFTIYHDNENYSVREIYKIPNDAKVLLYVGNISQNKNQVQMVRAFGLLPEELQSRTWVLFCGEDHIKDGTLQSLIARSNYGSHLILCGGVEKTQMPLYYKAADGVVLLSIAEGFGLSLIEGMSFGLPCIMPNDLDAFYDIYDERSVIPVEERTDKNVSNAITQLLKKRWIKSVIRQCAKKFLSDEMAKNYICVYRTIILTHPKQKT